MLDWPSDLIYQMWHDGKFAQGATEPWTARIVASLAAAINAKIVLETGTFLGTTTSWLAAALSDAYLTSVDIRPECVETAKQVVSSVRRLPDVTVDIKVRDAMEVITLLPVESMDFVFIDDDHDAHHVEREIIGLANKVRRGGMIVLHDVDGPLGLGEVVRRHGGFCIKLPKLHKAGGLGIIQR